MPCIMALRPALCLTVAIYIVHAFLTSIAGEAETRIGFGCKIRAFSVSGCRPPQPGCVQGFSCKKSASVMQNISGTEISYIWFLNDHQAFFRFLVRPLTSGLFLHHCLALKLVTENGEIIFLHLTYQWCGYSMVIFVRP